MSTRILSFGLGPIGAAIVRQLHERTEVEIVGAIDIDAQKRGRDVGDVVGIGQKIGATVWSDALEALQTTKPDVVILCTSSALESILSQIELCTRNGAAVVSTSEELVYPLAENRALLQNIDRIARDAGVAVLGTGVNPGFAMDALPIMLTGVCQSVKSVRVCRVQDAGTRRLPFQRKIGAGLTLEQFDEAVKEGKVRHVGLAESVQMIADAIGLQLERISDDIRPKVATTRTSSDDLVVEQGLVCGLIQDGVGYARGESLINLHMEAYIGSPETYDAVEVDGSPTLSMKVSGGIHGDIATASIVVNSIPRVLKAQPGYLTMRDLPIPSFWQGDTVQGQTLSIGAGERKRW